MTHHSTINLLTILGATASGKTRLAVSLADAYGGEIISADSRQVCRGMDIGTGKDLHEYGSTPHHLIDIIDAGQQFSVFEFQRLFFKAFEEVTERGRLPILCGGTGMYLDAVLRGYRLMEVPVDAALRASLEARSDQELVLLLQQLRPRLHNSTDLCERDRLIRAIEIAMHEQQEVPENPHLPVVKSLVIGIRWERSQLRHRITERLRQRCDEGLIDEVQRLHDSGLSWQQLDYYGLEYRFVGAYLRGELCRNDMFQKLNSAIHDFAKRQETWFRRMERQGVSIQWVPGEGDTLSMARELIEQALRPD